MAIELTTPANPRRRLAVLFSIPLAFSLLFFAVTALTEHTDVELSRLQDMSSSVVQLRFLVAEIEAGERGFLLTGDDQYLAPFKNANERVEGQIEACISRAADQSPLWQQDVAHLASLVRQRAQLAERAIEIERTSGLDAAVAVVRTGEAEQVTNQIRLSVGKLQGELSQEELNYLRRQFRLNHLAFAFFVIGTFVVVIVTFRLYHTCVSYFEGRDALARELKELNLTLEAQVDERTRDLKSANEELQQFAYVASHDLQEPLRTVTSFSQLLESRYKGKLDQDADEFIGYIVTSARRMTDLINGLLALARLRKTGQPTTPVSFNDLLAEAEVGLKAAIRDSKAQITHDELPSLVVDKVQLLQVLQNLLSNSIKYRRDDEPLAIHISAKRNNTDWVFTVRDNGRGFDPRFADRIFGLFQRVHGREVADGTGMGLSITRKIIERHGGRIWAESAEGEGATFFFSLPVSLEVSHPPEDQQSPKAFAHVR